MAVTWGRLKWIDNFLKFTAMKLNGYGVDLR